jgi:hypothetical protein
VSPLRRIRFRRGDLLRAADLRTETDRARRLAALHVRGAHATSGIGLGWGLSRAGSDLPGARVGPGAGFDACGRAVATGATAFVPAPSEDGEYVLTAAEEGWAWRDERCLGRDEIPVAAFALTGETLGPPDLAARRGARGPGPGRIASGHADMSPDWRPETVITVSTAGAGFESTPLYFATLAEDVRAAARPRGLLGPWLEIADATAAGFTLVARFAGSHQALASLGQAGDATVHWLGLERPARCEAPPARATLAAPGGLRAPTGLFEHAFPDFDGGET